MSSTRERQHTEAGLGGDWLLVGFTFLAALSSRLALLSIGPLLPQMKEDLGLSDTTAGILTGLPLLLMGILAIPAGVVSDRLGPRRVLAGTMVAMVIGGGARGFVQTPWALLVATAVLGSAIGLAQPAMAQVAREARTVGPTLATAVYSNGFVTGAIISFGLAVPLSNVAGSWPGVLRWWAVVGIVAALGWLALAARRSVQHGTGAALRWGLGDVLAIPGLFACAVVFSAQNVIFYAVAAWLPLLFVSYGWDRQTASLPLFALEVVAIGASLVSSYLAGRVWSTRAVLGVCCAISTVGLVGLLLAPTAAPFVWPILIGGGLSSVLVLTLTAPAALARPERVGAAAGAFLTLGFFGAMVGPFVVGLLRDLTGSFEPGIAVLLATSVLMLGGTFFTPRALDARRGSR